jgi:hypothetical protein
VVSLEVDRILGVPERVGVAQLILEALDALSALPPERRALLALTRAEVQRKAPIASEVSECQQRLHQLRRPAAYRVGRKRDPHLLRRDQ